MHFWLLQNEKHQKHLLYRCRRLALMHNPDYINKHANEAKEFARGSSKECEKRLKEEMDKRLKSAFPITTGPKSQRLSHG